MSPPARNLKNEPLLEAILDSMQDGLTVLDRDLLILHANRPVRDHYSEKLPLEGKACYSAFRDRDEPCENCPTLRAIESRKMERSEVRSPAEGGRTRVWELTAWPILDDSGGVAALVESFRDVTAQREAESLRKEQESLYRSLFESNTSVILFIDPDTAAIRDANPMACAFYGHSRAALRKMKITEINVLSPEEVFEEMRRAKAEQRNHFNFSHRLADGSVREVEVFSGPITVGGQPLLASIVHDVSERKAAEREREKLIDDLRTALSEVKTLRGLIPICSSCSKVRDDEGYWNRIEVYIRDHSDAQLTHGLCPECVDRLYPDLEGEG